MGKTRKTIGVLTAPLMLAALALAGVGAVLGYVWSRIALTATERKNAAVASAVSGLIRARELD
jgi:hypothetical protein